jgi:hypothetical protein
MVYAFSKRMLACGHIIQGNATKSGIAAYYIIHNFKASKRRVKCNTCFVFICDAQSEPYGATRTEALIMEGYTQTTGFIYGRVGRGGSCERSVALQRQEIYRQ